MATHKRECHFDDNGNIIDGVKVWRYSELESRILFEVRKEKNPRDDETASNDNSNEPSTLIDKITGNNNAKDDKNDDDTERNPDQSVNNNQFQVNASDVIPQENSNDSNCSNQPKTVAKKSKVIFQENSNDSNCSNQTKTFTKKSKVNFQGMPTCSPININTLGLRISPRVDSMKENIEAMKERSCKKTKT